jgi:hypothetical protein
VLQSPFDPIFGYFLDVLPPVFREQFLLTPEARQQVRLEGIMDVWHRPRWLAPVFGLLGRAGILIAQTGRDIPTNAIIVAGRDGSGAPYHRFERTLGFKQPAHFVSTTTFDKQAGLLVDHAGPAGLLQVFWHARFEPPGTFVHAAGGYALGRGNRRLRLPAAAGRLLMGAGRFVQRVDEARPDTIHLDFTINFPVLGDIFGYRGTFRVRREPLNEGRLSGV